MHCYWSGEACLGDIPGVMASRTGHLGGAEVVELDFDPEQVRYEMLLREARRRGCADRVFALGPRQEAAARQVFGDAVTRSATALRPARSGDQKYDLRRSSWKDATLTPQQEVLVNAALAAERDPSPYLSPRQARAPER